MQQKITAIYKKQTLWIGEDMEGNLYHKAFIANTSEVDKERLGWKKSNKC